MNRMKLTALFLALLLAVILAACGNPISPPAQMAIAPAAPKDCSRKV